MSSLNANRSFSSTTMSYYEQWESEKRDKTVVILYEDDNCTNSECISFGFLKYYARLLLSDLLQVSLIVLTFRGCLSPVQIQKVQTVYNWVAPSLYFVVPVHFQGNNSFVSIVKQGDYKVVCCRYLSLKLRVKITNMIPPNASLVKYDNPVLVSRNTDKKSPRVS